MMAAWFSICLFFTFLLHNQVFVWLQNQTNTQIAQSFVLGMCFSVLFLIFSSIWVMKEFYFFYLKEVSIVEDRPNE